MPVRKTWDHAIELKERFTPRKGKVYLLSREEREEVQAFMEDQLQKGYIRPSKSLQTSPIHFVAKKDGKRRIVQDYRHINQWTVKNGYPLPLIADILDRVGKRKVFTKLDLRWGYNNVRIKEGDKWKAAFTTYIRAYEPTVMYFGLTNSPATFQTMMNDLFQDLINQGDMATFIDDILVVTDTEEGHDELVEEVLKRLEENDLFVKPEKCKWKVREVEFLGVVIGPKGVEMQKEKVEGVLNWPAPRNVKEVQKFLGLANYYRRFIKDFAKIAAPLHVLVRKEQKWKWEKEQEKAFGKLKEVFTTEPVLAIPDIDREMRVEADASDYATGGVLSLKGEDSKWRPVAFISKSLNAIERNYEIHDKEILAVIKCLEAWRHYLERAKLEFEIWTDHKNLQYFMTSQKLNRRQARWALYLSRFSFTLKHILGKSMGKADGLSRRPDWQEGVERDNEDQTLIKPEWVRAAKTLVEEGNLREQIKKAQEGDERVVKAVEELKKAGVKMLRDEEWEIEDGVVLKEGRIYVPEGELRGEVIQLHHDTPVEGHGGRWKTTELVMRNYWWPGVTKEVGRYVDRCDACQRYKNRSEAPAGKLMPNAIPEKPWSHISADFITKLPLAQGYDAILVVYDRFSKMAHFIATTEKTSAEGLAKLF